MLAHSGTLWHELLCITKYDQWLLKLLEKKSFLLAEYTSSGYNLTVTAIPDRKVQHPCLCHFTKLIQIRTYTHSIAAPVRLQNYSTKRQCHSHAKCKWCYKMGREWVVLVIKLWMNLTKHTWHTHAFGEKSIGFSVRLNLIT